METILAPTALRPGADEYAPFYAGYVARVPEGDVVATLERQLDEVVRFFRDVPAEREGHRYAPGKWSVREVAGHIADTERIMAYRALRIARGDATPLPGFDENAYVPPSGFDARPLASLAEEWAAVRRATLPLFRHLDAEGWARRGTASDAAVSVRALAHIIAGHAEHHLEVLRTRYLGD
ncbi:MAG TPA: DinB family protein [Longimicrobium sp.]|nr:DinB family protein [Longimicrobium sp.]